MNSWNTVKPFYNCEPKKNAFHLVSPAGHLRFIPRDVKETCRFRDIYLNQFVQLGNKRDFFRLYKKIRKNERWMAVKYRGNLRTWIRYRIGL